MKRAIPRARTLDEPAARSLCARVAAETGLRPLPAVNPHDDSLRWGEAGVARERWGSAGGLGLFRIGSLLFLEEIAARGLSPGLAEALGANAVLVRGLKDSTLAGVGGDYTMLAIAAMLRARLAGRHVVDAGAGDGLLSLAASRLGARSLELVDIDGRALAAAGANLRLNGLAERTDFRLLDADLSDPDAAGRILRPGAAPVAVVCNIGYWEYSATNAEVIMLLDRLPRGESFIGGGYSSASTGGLSHLEADAELLGAMGFRAAPEMAAMVRDDWRSLRGREEARAFLAVQAGGPRAGREELEGRLAARRRTLPARLHSWARAALPWLLLAAVLLVGAALYLAATAGRSAPGP